MTRIEWKVAVLGVAPVADRNRTDSPGDDPVDDDRHEEDRREPDPSESPSRKERKSERNRHQEAAEALVEVLLNEEGAVAAENAPFDRSTRRRPFEPDGVGRRALPARELPSVGVDVVARFEAARTVPAGAHAGYAGKPVAIVK